MKSRLPLNDGTALLVLRVLEGVPDSERARHSEAGEREEEDGDHFAAGTETEAEAAVGRPAAAALAATTAGSHHGSQTLLRSIDRPPCVRGSRPATKSDDVVAELEELKKQKGKKG